MRINDKNDSSIGIELIILKYLKLKKFKPDNHLLKLIEMHPDDLGFETTDEFDKKFVHDEDSSLLPAYVRYAVAIERTMQGKPYVLPA